MIRINLIQKELEKPHWLVRFGTAFSSRSQPPIHGLKDYLRESKLRRKQRLRSLTLLTFGTAIFGLAVAGAMISKQTNTQPNAQAPSNLPAQAPKPASIPAPSPASKQSELTCDGSARADMQELESAIANANRYRLGQVLSVIGNSAKAGEYARSFELCVMQNPPLKAAVTEMARAKGITATPAEILIATGNAAIDAKKNSAKATKEYGKVFADAVAQLNKTTEENKTNWPLPIALIFGILAAGLLVVRWLSGAVNGKKLLDEKPKGPSPDSS